MPISSIDSHGHSTPISSMGLAVKLLVLLPRTQLLSFAVFFLAVRPFENTQDAMVYNDFFEAVSSNEK